MQKKYWWLFLINQCLDKKVVNYERKSDRQLHASLSILGFTLTTTHPALF
jgi:hypothetical protein